MDAAARYIVPPILGDVAGPFVPAKWKLVRRWHYDYLFP
jgi:hypothetical protein